MELAPVCDVSKIEGAKEQEGSRRYDRGYGHWSIRTRLAFPVSPFLNLRRRVDEVWMENGLWRRVSQWRGMKEGRKGVGGGRMYTYI